MICNCSLTQTPPSASCPMLLPFFTAKQVWASIQLLLPSPSPDSWPASKAAILFFLLWLWTMISLLSEKMPFSCDSGCLCGLLWLLTFLLVPIAYMGVSKIALNFFFLLPLLLAILSSLKVCSLFFLAILKSCFQSSISQSLFYTSLLSSLGVFYPQLWPHMFLSFYVHPNSSNKSPQEKFEKISRLRASAASSCMPYHITTSWCSMVPWLNRKLPCPWTLIFLSPSGVYNSRYPTYLCWGLVKSMSCCCCNDSWYAMALVCDN